MRHPRAAALVLLVGLVVVPALLPGIARAQETDEDARRRAVLRGGAADRVRLVTTDGRTLEGRLFIQRGDTVRVFGAGAGGGYIDEFVPAADIRFLSVPKKYNKEPVRIGGFVGGQIAAFIGYALNDVNTLYTTAAGTVIGYGVGYSLRDRDTAWNQLYPPAEPPMFVRAGWFVAGSFGAARVEGAAEDDILLAGGAALGSTVSPRFALAVGSGSWADPEILTLDAVDLYSTVGLRCSWTPGVGLVMGVGGGAAVGEHTTGDDKNDLTDWGWGVSGMAAWEFRVGRTTLIGPAVSIDYMYFGGDYFDDVTLVTFALRLVTY